MEGRETAEENRKTMEKTDMKERREEGKEGEATRH